MKKRFRARRFGVVLTLAAAMAGGGYVYASQVYLPAQVPATPALQTAKVRSGDIIITAAGAGNLVPAAELDLGFRSAGSLAEIAVQVGDRVEAGQVLARLDDSAALIQVAQAELNLEEAGNNSAELTSATAITKAEVDVAKAGAALEAAQAALTAANDPAPAAYEDAYQAALAELEQAKNAAVATNAGSLASAVFRAQEGVDRAAELVAQVTAAINGCAGCDPSTATVNVGNKAYTLPQAQDDYNGALNNLTLAQVNLEAAQYKNDQAIAAAQATADSAYWSWQAALRGPDSDAVAQAELEVRAAEANLADAQARLADLQAGNPPATTAVRQAELNLENARLALAGTTLVAPMAGTVTAVKADAGEAVGTAPIITLAALDQPWVRFYVEESDLGKVAVGYPVHVSFDAAPEVVFSGEVVRLDPALVTVDGSPAVQAWATLDPASADLPVQLLAGLSAEVEIVAGEAKNALLVPVQALRELAPGSFAVFVVLPDGQLRLTPVTVGLKDFASAEILAGLKAGDVVSTGTVETK